MAEASDATILEQTSLPISDSLKLQPIPPHIQNMMKFYEKAVGAFTDEFCDPNLQIKAAILEGGVHSGKTSFMAAVAYSLQQRLAKDKQVQSQIFFTRASLQQTVGLPENLPLDRTGIKYDKIPNFLELAKFDGKIIIVLDEISQKAPFKELWEKYINLPNTIFLLAIHPGSPYLEEWKKLFPENTEIISMDMIR